ncbi:MAG TPA: hypothetical protein VG603_09335 [Chitinophagales bacterium]|nr:hypothetical protein [Chitinophagales bacterium]
MKSRMRVFVIVVFLVFSFGCKKELTKTFAGTYHVSGYVQTSNVDTTYPAQYMDTNIVITSIDENSLEFWGEIVTYRSTGFDSNYYTFREVYCCGFYELKFHNPYTDDSVFVTKLFSGSPASNTSTVLSGKK